MSNEARTGQCQCGAIRFHLTAEPQRVYACHCSECRRQSASAFGISVIMDEDSVSLDQGTPKIWHRPTSSGGSMACAFCPDCGSRLWHRAGGVISVKGGSLTTPLTPTSHIWLDSKLPWVIIPEGTDQWPQEPDD